MAAGKTGGPEKKKAKTLPDTRSVRDAAEQKLAGLQGNASELTGQTPEQLLHELRVHQIELEMQAEELRRAHIALEESRDKYLDLYEFAPLGYLTLNDKAQISGANLTAATLLGIERNKLLRAPISKFMSEKDADQCHLYFQNLLSQGGKQICTLVLTRGDGSTFPARLEGVRITDRSDGTPTVRVTISDITDIRVAEEAARVNQAKYQVLFESVPLGITVSDKTGNIVESNRMAEELLGLSNKDQVGRQIGDRQWHIIRTDGSPMPAGEFASVRALKEGCLVSDIEMGLVKDEGEITWISVTAAPIPLKGYGVSIAYSNITGRKRAEEKLKESERFLTTIVEQIPDMIFVKDARDLRFVRLNKAGEDLLGYSREEILGKTDHDFFPEDEADFFIGNDRQVLLTNKLSDNPSEKISTRYKGERLLHTKKIPVVDEKGVPRYLLGISEDVTERKQIQDALQESERKYRNLYRYAQVGLFETSFKDGTVVACNERYATLAGFSSAEDAIGKDIVHLYENPDDHKKISRILHQEGHIDDCIIRLKKHLTGSPFWAQFSARFNHETGVAEGSIIDITENKRAEDALRESDARFDQLAEQSNTVTWEVDTRGLYTYVNHVAEAVWGYSPDKLVGQMHYYDLHPASGREAFRKATLAIFGQKEPFRNLENIVQAKDGREVWVSTNGIPLLNADGTLRGYRGSDTKITERKRAEEALRESEKRYRNLFENMLEGFAYCRVLYDEEKHPADFIYLNINPAFDRIFGTTTVMGKSATEVFPGIKEAFPELFEIYGRVALAGEPESFDLEFKPSSKWLHISVYSPATEYFVAIFEDITERKTAEETIRTFSKDLERQISERTSDLADDNLKLVTEIAIRLDAEKQLNKTVAEKEVLLKEVHHRVKNNLQIIISLLNLQSRYITDETTRSAFRESQNRVRAMALVHEKLYQSADLAKLDLENYLKFLGDNLFQFLGMKGKGITLTMDIRDIFLAIDTAIPLGLMINELISNSLKYAFPDRREGAISLAIHRQNNTLTILFADNGVGITEDFDWRNAKSLGLRLVCSLVEQLDGTIELDRSSGTAFTIVIKEKE